MQKKWLIGFPDRESQKKTIANYEIDCRTTHRIYDVRVSE